MKNTVDKCSYCGYYLSMITVGIKDLKNQLSRYLQYVKEGEKVVVTEHNRIIAEISLPGGEKRQSLEEKLEKMAARGDIIPAKRNKTRLAPPETKYALDWEKYYGQTRSDRL